MNNTERNLIQELLDQGLKHHQAGDLASAEKYYKKVLDKKPDHADAMQLSGTASFQLGNLVQAKNLLSAALAINPDMATAQFNLGNVLTNLGETNNAIQAYQRAVNLNPGFYQAYSRLGNIYKAINKPELAIRSFEKVIELAPTIIDSYLSLGAIFSQHFDYKNEAEVLKKAIAAVPDHIGLLIHLGSCYINWSKPDLALEYLQQATTLDPNNQQTMGYIAAIYILRGDYQKAHQSLQPFLQLPDPDYGIVSAYADIAHRFDEEDNAIRLLKDALKSPELGDKRKSLLNFALGNLFDRQGHYPQAFKCYEKGNQIVKPVFDRKQLSQHFDNLIAAHNIINHSQLPRSSITDTRPIFIIGMERSGTSLLEQILASHSRIQGAGETPEIPEITVSLQRLFGNPYPQCSSQISSEALNNLGKTYLNNVSNNSGDTSRITDKLPGNSINLGLIDLLFPEARIIHIKRDSMDNCLSIYFHAFAGFIPYAYDLVDLGYYYQEYSRLMDHWKNVIRIPLLEIEYEDLVNSPTEEIQRLIEFAGVEWEESCLNFHNTKRTVATNSSDQVRTPMYQSSVARWKNYEQYLAPLQQALGKNNDVS